LFFSVVGLGICRVRAGAVLNRPRPHGSSRAVDMWRQETLTSTAQTTARPGRWRAPGGGCHSEEGFDKLSPNGEISARTGKCSARTESNPFALSLSKGAHGYFGSPVRDSGHGRVPELPAMLTGWTGSIVTVTLVET
jgi:hypothetical protein